MFDFVFEFLANLLNSKKLQNESNVRYFCQIHQNNLDINLKMQIITTKTSKS